MRSVGLGAVRSYRSGKLGAPLAPIGVEPPIVAQGDRLGVESQRRVSPRWLAGTALTGLIGAGLLGGAIYAAFDRQAYFAQAPTRAIPARREQPEDSGVNPKKGDRLLKAVDIVAAKQTFKAAIAIKAGDKEVMKTHTFTRVSTTLTQAETGLSADVPDFNPLKLLADSRNPAPEPAEPAPADEDADVSFTSSDLYPVSLAAQSATLSLDEVRAQIAETVRNAQSAGAKAPLPLPPQLLLMRTSRAGLETGANGLGLGANANTNANSPFSSIEVRMVPENVTLAPRTTDPTSESGRSPLNDDRLVTVAHGDDIDDILARAGLGKDVIANIKTAFRSARLDKLVADGRRIKLSFADAEKGAGRVLARLSIYDQDNLKATIALADDGHYQLLAKAPVEAKAARPSDGSDEEDDPGAMRLYNSFFETALKQDIPHPIIDRMVRIFANDVDFQRAVSPGDSIEAFYDDGDEANGSHAELLFASITSRGETYKYYRFESPEDHSVDFYDPLGRSTRKFLLRKPMATGEFTSGFGMRYHPILHYTRPHNGVDWAAPIGTPVFATGSGAIEKAGWDAGYGRRVEIAHGNGYVTTYNHMSRFGRGIVAGVHVNQGQIVGYLGASGLATGPHLHYEVIVNGHYVDPMRVKLARTRQVDSQDIAEFKHERDRIDNLMAKAPTATRVAGQ
ncbi:M23 family metallopeptidase [Rhodoblastus acidophilus]|uniref:M23 family metallopeptidase n=1 Tax=Candidatus Rhodoblastus alkanivorans TaxID=2954117 RepID=A0ABS9Z0M8_9HYPH|nr:M23 family metallopeptidase [Candidatus Rhodoblastus alkanivorans]MCI4678138.1 M23 family metallopeptidase [Candidatus Rhodoblastus alkanivorans]MCI4681188.1 M23 family metallopeptidase [Candidatus Rhodoblastus alkanivorans]MDI4642231.1 M23 family metallopeptidase [Rhodoblastus acidophilus]